MRRTTTSSMLLAAALGALACSAPPALDLSGQNLVLITIDTLRADRLGSYGDDRASTPSLDTLAAQGSRFVNCYSSVTLTLPSHATLFTGRYPFAHGARLNAIHYLPAEEVTLAERFRDRGYETYAAVSSYVVSRKFGLAQGFEAYDDSLGSGELFGAFEAEIAADRVAEKWRRWLDGRGGRPFFAWIHFYDPHLPYEPPAAHRARAGDDAYRGEIAFVDAQVGAMRAEIEAHGLAEDTVIMVTSDHGEAFGEHVEEGHGLLAYDDTLKVPFIVHAPGRLANGQVIDSRIGLVDVAATVTELFGLEPLASAQGESFAPLLAGRPGDDRRLYFEAMAGRELKGWAGLTGLIAGRFKLIVVPQAELYDLKADPGERDNRIAKERTVARELRAALEAMLAGGRERAAERELTGRDRQQLEALGYLGTGDGAGTGPELDPKRGIVIDMAIRRGRRLLEQGEVEGARRELALAEAEEPGATVADFFILRHEIEDAAGNRDLATAALREVVALFPALEHLHFQLATYLYAGGEVEEAERITRQLLAANPRMSQAYNLLAAAARQRGELAVALAHFRSGLAIEPESTPLKLEIVDLLVATGDLEAAGKIYEELVTRGALDRDAPRLFKAAMLRGRSGDLDGAIALFRRGLALDSQPVQHLTLAVLLAQSGRLDEAQAELETALRGGLPEDQRALAAGLLAQWRR